MARWPFDALEGMDESPQVPADVESLVPDGGMLELYVTITDFYGYDRQLPIAEPKLVHDQRHRHGLVFLDEFASRRFRLYELAEGNPEKTQFVDGGVLDNKPFGWSIGNIIRRPADVEVDRRLLYLEPDPGEAHLPDPDAPARSAPGTIQAAIGAASGVPRKEPILDDLLELQAHNERVALIRDVIETNFDVVAGILEDTLGPFDQLASKPDIETLSAWNKATHAQAVEQAGPAYSGYLRLKISAAADRYAQTVCTVCDYPVDSNHAMLVRHAIRSWAEKLGLFERSTTTTEARLSFLRNFDLGFGQRRIDFVNAAMRWWYRDLRAGKPDIPSRSQLDEGKQILYGARRLLRETMGSDGYPEELQARLRECFPQAEIGDLLAREGLQPAAFITEHEKQLTQVVDEMATFQREQLSGFNKDLFGQLSALAADWAEVRRRDLIVRYLGFPMWDVLLYSIQQLANAGEKDAIEVVRLSPYEADVLETKPADKVQGKKRFHFGAFFDRRARENDYLWGRLDGAANLIAVVLGKDHPQYRAWCMRAFAATLREEREALPNIAPTLQALGKEVAAGQAAIDKPGRA